MALSEKRGWGRGAGWAAGALALIVALVCVRLGFWQLDRLERRRADNATAAAGLSLPPSELDPTLLDSVEANPAAFLYRHVTANGSYLPVDLILRGRSHEGSPGVHLVSPLRLEKGGSLLLVNRGWLPSADGATADPLPFRESGPVSIEGVLLQLPDNVEDAVPATMELESGPVASFRRLDRTQLAEVLGSLPAIMYLQLTPDSSSGRAEAPVPVPLPEQDEGPHLGYAIQWFGFAAVAFGGLVLIIFRGRKRRLVHPL